MARDLENKRSHRIMSAEGTNGPDPIRLRLCPIARDKKKPKRMI